MSGKHAKALIALLCALLIFAGCGQRISEGDIADKTYVYEKGGFGGPFTVTLRGDGSFTYSEGLLSSYIGSGDWELDEDTLILRDTAVPGRSRSYSFLVEDGELVFVKDGSSSFDFIGVSDGERFSPDDGTRNLPGSGFPANVSLELYS